MLLTLAIQLETSFRPFIKIGIVVVVTTLYLDEVL